MFWVRNSCISLEFKKHAQFLCFHISVKMILILKRNQLKVGLFKFLHEREVRKGRILGRGESHLCVELPKTVYTV
jgi:hypothetical protein